MGKSHSATGATAGKFLKSKVTFHRAVKNFDEHKKIRSLIASNPYRREQGLADAGSEKRANKFCTHAF
jgi:hypothetical protein